MKSLGILKSGMLGIVIFFSLSGASRIFAQFQERERLFDIYVGFNANYDLPYHSEVFNGEYFVASEEEIIILPKLDPNYGFNLAAGLRAQDINLWNFINGFSAELWLHRSSHDYTYPLLDLSGTSRLTEAGFNVKCTVFKGKVLRPFFASGFGLAWLNVRDGSFSGTSPVTFGNASFFGGAGDLLSVGLDIFISQKVSFFTSLSYSVFGFWSVKGISGTRYQIKFEDKTLNVSYPKIAVGIVFTVAQIRE